jgi:prevent-host-death family protein
MSEQYSIAEASDNFAQVVHTVEQGKSVEITRQGKTVAIVLSLEEYKRLTTQRFEFGKGLEAFRQKYQVQNLDIDSDNIFEDVRDKTTGHDTEAFDALMDKINAEPNPKFYTIDEIGTLQKLIEEKRTRENL